MNVDKHGNPIKLDSRQKNALYSQAKDLKSQIKEGLCSNRETRDPNSRNVQKMINSEFKNNAKVEQFQKTMKAIGADPRDYGIEKMRRE